MSLASGARRPWGPLSLPTRQLSLRTRLTLAFAAITLLCLALAGTAVVFILQDYQASRETRRVADLAQPLSFQVRSIEQQGASRAEIVDFLERQAGELDLRIVIADNRGLVLADTDDSLVGQRLQLQPPNRTGLPRPMRAATFSNPSGETTFMVSPPVSPAPATASGEPAATPGPTLTERFNARPSAYLVGLSVPPQSAGAAWLELLPRLTAAGLVALLASVFVAWLLASSISRPLARVTGAAEAMARGELAQTIPVRGRDEVARLSSAFNTMAREVAMSQRMLKDFLANVSHDLRTPLTSIQGFSQALTDGTLVDRADIAEAGAIIHGEAGRMSRLVDDVLLLSKMESGQTSVERAPLELSQLVADRVRAFQRAAAEARVELTGSAANAPIVLGDGPRLEQVVDNLLGNALRHTPSGGSVAVLLSSGPDKPRADQPGALLVVRNSGSYIPEAELERVFERFYQLDKSRAAGSSGLGLAIVRQIVLAHGGRCWATSEPDSGSCFHVWLPATPQIDQDGQAQVVSTQRPGSAIPAVIPVGRPRSSA
ncbi:MAG: HAMP domain-containing histidine kinase [Chloroflexi bacterium]|nr:HAMP domain-containing histidine kinase [Chloroflexota bacterium]